MEKFASYLQNLNGVVFAESNGKIKQTQARKLKSGLLGELVADIQGSGFEVAKVQKGYIVRVPNENLGSIVLGLDLQVKPLDYDFDAEAERETKRLAEIKAKKSKSKKSAK